MRGGITRPAPHSSAPTTHPTASVGTRKVSTTGRSPLPSGGPAAPPDPNQRKGTALSPPTTEVRTEDGAVINPEAFVDMVGEWPKGMLGLELSEALTACTNATQLHGGKSTLTLTVQVERGKSIEGEFLVTTEVKSKPYSPKVAPATFFPTADGGLSRRDPNQPALPGTEEL